MDDVEMSALDVETQAVIVPAGDFSLQGRTAFAPSRNPALVYIASLSSGSRRTMRVALQTIVDVLLGFDPGNPDVNPNRTVDGHGNSCPIITWDAFPWHEMDYQHTAAVRAVLVSRYKKRTSVKMLSAMRRVLKECWRLGYISVERYQRAVDLERISGDAVSQAQTGRHVERDEITALLEACADNSLSGVRDAALIAVAYNCGLRRAELSALAIDDVDMVQLSLRVVGKGNKERMVYVGQATAAYLAAWLRARSDYAGAVFGRITKADRLLLAADHKAAGKVVAHMSDQAIYAILKRRAAQALVDSFSPHDMRRTFAGNLLDAGADLVIVQKLMGHSDPSTTAGYDRRSSRAQKDAVERLNIPIIDEIVDYSAQQ